MSRSLSDNHPNFIQDFIGSASNFPGSPTLPPIILMTDEARGINWADAIHRLPDRAAVIFRHYKAPDRRKLGQQLRAIAADKAIPFLVAEDIDLARTLKADGIHLPERAIGDATQIRKDQSGLIITAAAHGRDAVEKAGAAAVDAILISPVFETQSHPGATCLGVDGFTALAQMARQQRLAPYALGGVDHSNIGSLKDSGAAGIAAIGALINPIKKD